MKKIYIAILIILSAVGFSACEADKDPVFSEATEFVLNTPPFADQVCQLQSGSTLQFTCSKPNYGNGLALVPEYGLEVSLHEDFGQNQSTSSGNGVPLFAQIAVTDPYSTVIDIEEQNLANAMCTLMGINEEDYYYDIPIVPLYVRATAHINHQPATMITSNVIKLEQVLTYIPGQDGELDVIYSPGKSNGWSFKTCACLQAYEKGKYRGFMYLNGAFKFTGAAEWSTEKGNWGAGGETGTLENGSNTNIALPDTGEGLYYAEVDTNALTYTLTYISSVGIAGDFNDWETSSDHMNGSDNYLLWTYEGNVSGQFKFLMNDKWTINLGGSLNKLAFNGANIDKGTFSKITLDLSQLPYTATIE